MTNLTKVRVTIMSPSTAHHALHAHARARSRGPAPRSHHDQCLSPATPRRNGTRSRATPASWSRMSRPYTPAVDAPASSNLDNGEAHHEAHPTPDTIVSQACLLLALNSQLENKPTQSSVLQRAEKVSSPRARAGGAASWPRSTRCTRRCSRRSSTSGSTISTRTKWSRASSSSPARSLRRGRHPTYSCTCTGPRARVSRRPALARVPRVPAALHASAHHDASPPSPQVLSHACLACHALIQHSPPARDPLPSQARHR